MVIYRIQKVAVMIAAGVAMVQVASARMDFHPPLRMGQAGGSADQAESIGPARAVTNPVTIQGSDAASNAMSIFANVWSQIPSSHTAIQCINRFINATNPLQQKFPELKSASSEKRNEIYDYICDEYEGRKEVAESLAYLLKALFEFQKARYENRSEDERGLTIEKWDRSTIAQLIAEIKFGMKTRSPEALEIPQVDELTCRVDDSFMALAHLSIDGTKIMVGSFAIPSIQEMQTYIDYSFYCKIQTYPDEPFDRRIEAYFIEGIMISRSKAAWLPDGTTKRQF